jgi:tetratricopeptide (TPR) repeat protein
MRRWTIALTLAALAMPASAFAQEGDGESEGEPETAAPPTLPPEIEAEARSRFELGTSLYHQGRTEEALVEFERAHEISGRPEFYYNIYLCHRDAGELREAEASLSNYLEESAADAVPNRGLLERRLATLREQIAAEEQAQQAEAEARRAAEDAERRAAEGTRMELREPNRTGPAILLGVGGAAILAGAGLGISALFLHDELEQECFGSACPYWKSDEIDQLRRRTIAFDVLMGAGGAMVLGGMIWWLVDKPVEVPVSASCGPFGCVVEGRF